jgi:hypothetical protein
MTLKTATLIAIIGLALHVLFRLLEFIAEVYDMEPSPTMVAISMAVTLALIDGSLIFFLSVLYRKQKD